MYLFLCLLNSISLKLFVWISSYFCSYIKNIISTNTFSMCYRMKWYLNTIWLVHGNDFEFSPRKIEATISQLTIIVRLNSTYIKYNICLTNIISVIIYKIIIWYDFEAERETTYFVPNLHLIEQLSRQIQFPVTRDHFFLSTAQYK